MTPEEEIAEYEVDKATIIGVLPRQPRNNRPVQGVALARCSINGLVVVQDGLKRREIHGDCMGAGVPDVTISPCMHPEACAVCLDARQVSLEADVVARSKGAEMPNTIVSSSCRLREEVTPLGMALLHRRKA